MRKPSIKSIIYFTKLVIVNAVILGILMVSTTLYGGYWLTSLLSNPAKVDNVLLKNLGRNFYNERRNLIQLMPECSKYDPELTYTLRPDGCNFSNAEFSVEVSVNSQGLRDDEAPLSKPEMIVLGDSHALGWGVQQVRPSPLLLKAEPA